jgi:uncharacterized protein YodC (DUF2158 family)
MTFQPGDVVALKSGGQAMTVAEVTDSGAECIWIGEEGELFRETLPLAVLRGLDGGDDEEEADEEEEEEEDEREADEDDRKIA